MVKGQAGKGRTTSRAHPWWKDPKWIITTLIGLLGALGVSSLITMALTKDSSTAEELRKCQELRGLRTTPQKVIEEYPADQSDSTGLYRKTTFSSCTWPPSDATAGDGYSEVVAIFARGPGDSEASGATLLDRVTATCPTVQFTYQLTAQGSFNTLKPFTLKRGAVAYAGDGHATPWTGKWEANSPYPAPDEMVILHDGKMSLAMARCVRPD
jgi:hypothetical protein